MPASPLGSPAGGIPRELSVGALVVDADSPIVLADVARDPRLAANPRLCDHDVHFCAGTPLRDRDRRPLGALCILDPEPRTMSEAETALLAEMADELMQRILDDA